MAPAIRGPALKPARGIRFREGPSLATCRSAGGHYVQLFRGGLETDGSSIRSQPASGFPDGWSGRAIRRGMAIPHPPRQWPALCLSSASGTGEGARVAACHGRPSTPGRPFGAFQTSVIPPFGRSNPCSLPPPPRRFARRPCRQPLRPARFASIRRCRRCRAASIRIRCGPGGWSARIFCRTSARKPSTAG